MKCAACHAYIGVDTTVCPHCGHSGEAGKSPKKTMMGLPAILATGNTNASSKSAKPAAPIDRNTLYGTPAVPSDAGGAPKDSAEWGAPSEPDGSTQIAPPSVVEAALSGSFETGYGLPAIADREADKPEQSASFSQAWGLEEESEEAGAGSTQVAGAAMMAAIRDSRFDLPAVGAPPAPKRPKSTPKQTMMGLNFNDFHDDMAPPPEQEDTTRPVESERLDLLRSGVSPSGILSGQGVFSTDSCSEEDDDGPATQALTPDAIAALERGDPNQDASTDRRKSLLNRLRANTDSVKEHSRATPAPQNAIVSTSRLAKPHVEDLGEDLRVAAIEDSQVAAVEVEIESIASVAVEPVADVEGEPVADVEVEPLVEVEPEPVDTWGRGPRFSIPEPAKAPSAPEVQQRFGDDELDEIAFGDDDLDEADDFIQESFISSPPAFGADASAALPEPPIPEMDPLERDLRASGIDGRGVFDSLEGFPPGLIPESQVPVEEPLMPQQGAPVAPSPQAPALDFGAQMPAAQPMASHELAAPTPAGQTSQPPAEKQPKAAALKMIRMVCALLGAVGLILAGLGGAVLLGGEGLGLPISATIATITLVAGCILMVCAGLFLLALRWIS